MTHLPDPPPEFVVRLDPFDGLQLFTLLGEVLLDKQVEAEDPLERAFDKIGDAHTIAVWLRGAMEVELQVAEAEAAISVVDARLPDISDQLIKESLDTSLTSLRVALAGPSEQSAPEPVTFEI